MTLYIQSYTYTVIDTPLTKLPLVITKEDLPPDPLAQVQRRMQMVLSIVLMAVIGFAVFVAPRLHRDTAVNTTITVLDTPGEAVAETAVTLPTGILSPVFSPEVRHWEPQIITWATNHDLDPDLVATVMQIESCGDPQALSSAGAHGLFQVMPFHFAAGEDMFHPDTNAFRGMKFLAELMQLTAGDVGLSLAGYNGGPRAALSTWSDWLPETQRYYTWGNGIYQDAKAGLSQSPTLSQWLEAGGVSLCQQAATRLGLPK